MSREEQRAAAIKRAQAAHPQFTMDHIASVLDASGLLDERTAIRCAWCDVPIEEHSADELQGCQDALRDRHATAVRQLAEARSWTERIN